jgi:chromosomal replication initiation ATPase DnaA
LFIPATKTQDVFFAIFNHLHQSGKQIILTSDTPPKDLEGMQERLLSRFRWGLNADIQLTIENIQKMVCEYFHLPYDRLLAKTRKREVVQARQITMYLAKKFTKSSLKNIGEHFGGFDHTTVIHSCQTVENLMDTDGEYKEHMLELQQKVQLASI